MVPTFYPFLPAFLPSRGHAKSKSKSKSVFLFSITLVTSDIGHDTSSLSSIRQKVTLKRENKVPPSDIMPKKKKNESLDSISNYISTFANIANNCMSELSQEKETGMDRSKLHYNVFRKILNYCS